MPKLALDHPTDMDANRAGLSLNQPPGHAVIRDVQGARGSDAKIKQSRRPVLRDVLGRVD